jgi:hypothetical protein
MFLSSSILSLQDDEGGRGPQAGARGHVSVCRSGTGAPPAQRAKHLLMRAHHGMWGACTLRALRDPSLHHCTCPMQTVRWHLCVVVLQYGICTCGWGQPC